MSGDQVLLLVEAHLRYVAIDTATFRRTALPGDVRAGLARIAEPAAS